MKYDYTSLNYNMVPIGFITEITKIEIRRILMESYKTENEQVFADLAHAAELFVRKSVCPKRLGEYPGYLQGIRAVLEDSVSFDMTGICQLYKILMNKDENEEVFRSKDAQLYLEDIIVAYNEAVKETKVHRIVVISCVLKDLIKLSPFREENKLMAGLLSWLLLTTNGYEIGKYVQKEREGLEHVFEEHVVESKNPWEFSEKFIDWLVHCSEKVFQRVQSVKGNKYTKNERIECAVINSSFPVTKADILQILPDISPTTVEAKLGDLCKKDIIEKQGSKRYAAYIKKMEEQKNG